MYAKAWGPSFALIILLSLFLMQVSRNLSDAWLAHWISSIDNSNTTLTQSETSSYSKAVQNYSMCFLLKIFSFQSLEECTTANDTANLTEQNLYASQNSYYLVIYIGIAVFNSIITLVRAFSFAYAGIRAAKFIHDRLLNSVLFVSIIIYLITSKQ